jgi:hypothetical protein
VISAASCRKGASDIWSSAIEPGPGGIFSASQRLASPTPSPVSAEIMKVAANTGTLIGGLRQAPAIFSRSTSRSC